MYALAATLTPDTYLDLARATYAEMVLAGVTAVGEFHYLHHGPGGTPYDDPNVMAEALRTAARDAGLRITLLDTAYLTGGIDAPLEGAQRRFGDHDADAWAARVAAIRPDDTLTVGAAIHSVRAVPLDAIPADRRARHRPPAARAPVRAAPGERAVAGHVRRHPDPAPGGRGRARPGHHRGPRGPPDPGGRRDPGLDADGRVPVPVHRAGPRRRDRARRACLHAGGRPPERRQRPARPHRPARGGALGRDARAPRRASPAASSTPAELIDLLTTGGHASLGDPTGGRLAAGAPADLVAVRTDTPRTAGADPAQLVLVAGSADVDTVVVGGVVRVEGGRHVLGDVGAMLGTAVRAAWEEAR